MSEYSTRKRKDVNLTTDAHPKRRRAEYFTAVYVGDDDDAAAEPSEIPLIEDIPEIVVEEEEDGGNDETQDDSNSDAVYSSDTEPGDTSDDEVEVDQVYLYDEALIAVENATSPPIVAAEGLVLDDYFEDGDHSFCDTAEDDGNDGDNEEEQEMDPPTETKGKKKDEEEDDGSWDAFDRIIRKPFKDKIMLACSKRSLVSCRVDDVRADINVDLRRRILVYKLMDRAWLRRDEVCAAEHQWARSFVGDLPEEAWSCRHINPDQPRIPVKTPERKKRRRVRVVADVSAAPRSPTPPIPAQPIIEISDAFTEDGQPVVEEPTFALDPALLSSVAAGGGVNVSLGTAEEADVVAVETLLALAMSGENSMEMKKVGGTEDVDDYPEIPSEDEADDDTCSGRASPDQFHRDVVDTPHQYSWGADEPLLLETLLPAVCLPM